MRHGRCEQAAAARLCFVCIHTILTLCTTPAPSGVARIWCEGGTGRGAEGGGEGCPLPTGGRASPEKVLNFYIKMVSSGAFWVAISYRLAACFTGIGDRSGTFMNYNYSLRKTVGKK